MNNDSQQGSVDGSPAGLPRSAAFVGRRDVDPAQSARAARGHWDAAAREYQAEHAQVLGEADLVWGPEGLCEADAHLLGDVAGRRILELGCGAAQCGRWLTSQGATVVGLDVSRTMLSHAQELDRRTGHTTALVQADGRVLPFRDQCFDVVMSSFGVLPFVADSDRVLSEVARVLVPGGTFALSVVHPFRWVFADTPDIDDLRVESAYFDRRPYVEEDRQGNVLYAEHHRTMGDRIREIRAAGLVLDDLVEPQWSREDQSPWGAWSPERSAMIPGTAILVGHRPRRPLEGLPLSVTNQ